MSQRQIIASTVIARAWRLLAVAVLIICGGGIEAKAQSMVTDTRIKTLVYTANDVYSIMTHYGYQSNIEFSPNERIQTISVGDLVSWQVIPADTHLFVRALAEDAHTNMTVITDKRTYQFDLFARPVGALKSSDLAYVIRFYYPDEYAPPALDGGGAMMEAAPPPPSPAIPAFPAAIESPTAHNFRYTISGPEDIAPAKIYDDGQRTYFQFHSGEFRPQINMVDLATGRETPAQITPQGNVMVVNAVGARFSVRANGKTVCVFNEMGAPPRAGGNAW